MTEDELITKIINEGLEVYSRGSRWIVSRVGMPNDIGSFPSLKEAYEGFLEYEKEVN